MTFDQYGYLTPYEVIETDIETFEEVFVKGFPSSSTRSAIFREYLTYLDQLRQIIDGAFYQWIDGSFTTQKPNPRDIDVVTFVDASFFDANEQLLRDWNRQSYVDAYFVRIFPKEHRQRIFYESDYLRWLHLFGRSREKKSKGIIQLQF
ncbi:DUF6932 family protein [Runella sp.]|jgi:hypothetical protein|uniref:DUF6932 family protein n=1 Tax=Runella sp. TaxID=1960881 RepID=UPI002619F663|nr:hypothetical protein [Runella sp.]